MQTYFFHIQAIRSKRLFWLLTLFITFFAAAVPKADAAYQAPLTDTQRRAYLKYYAPVILKMADEDSKTIGRDWITNFDFDRDGAFGSNRANWEDHLAAYIAKDATYANWKIRPTLYTALLEFQETVDSPKSVVLLYHVYHAMEEQSIHDWERVEIRIDNVTGKPGSATEKFQYVIATQHSMHVPRLLPNVQFMQTAGGKHPIILQGPWSDGSGIHKNELRHVTTPWATIDKAVQDCATLGKCVTAAVDVTNGAGSNITTAQRINYVFVPSGDTPARDYWGAGGLSGKVAGKAAKTDKAVTWDKVVRLTYELQDLADIMPTHADVAPCGSVSTEHSWKTYSAHWWTQTYPIQMSDSVISEPISGSTTLVPTSANCHNQKIAYHLYSNDDGSKDDAQGYPGKHWFWGAYITGIDGGSYTDEAFDGDPFYDSKTATTPHARTCAGAKSDPKYWCQHDYFAHRGLKGDDSNDKKLVEAGIWLPDGWSTSAKGGFDGRWVQLFSDRYEGE